MRLLRFIVVFLFVIPSYCLLAQDVIIEQNASVFSFKIGNVELYIDANHGAKVASLKYAGEEVLITQEKSSDYIWGSTLWPAPQSDWGWPPPLELDNGLYSTSIDSNVLTCVSPIELGMQFTKKYWINIADTSINTSYCLKNMTGEPINKALWEVTRMPANGFVFWQTGPGGTWGELANEIDTIGKYSWLDLSKVKAGKHKLFADISNGWFAHVNLQGRLFVRTFNDVNKVNLANGEGEIEIYVDGKYMELENLSKLQTINPGSTMTYETKWYLRYLPININTEVGSSDLLKGVNKIVFMN